MAAYQKQTWTDTPTGGTPMTAARMNHIEDGIKANSDAWDSVSQIETGIEYITPLEAGKTCEFDVKFSKPFSKTPAIVVSANTSIPQKVFVSYRGASASGMKIVLNRADVTETYISWVAVER